MKSVFYWSPILDSVTGQFRLSEVRKGLPAYNFGDVLGLELLQKVTGRRFAYGGVKTADIFVTGTVGQLVEMHGGAKEGAVIAGIGTDPKREPKIDWANRYDVRLVRGPLTRDRWGLASGIPLGDPGLIAQEAFGVVEKQYQIGYVRHFKDRTEAPAELRHSGKSIMIDAGTAPSEAIPLIASCERIITSSLHGAVVADSYGIPWRRHRAPVGLDLKWEDYRLAIEERGIEELKAGIYEVLSDL
ncbi:polysaccharide pyruvyl transferase family protein [Isoptericola sp. NPDC019482]|uniref:polysaccharide pyruvyl transferase family protein n=1 Tax=Isoptericola sp. NPDC019482 TaxID=3154688 RepID=UPI00349A2E25